MLIRTPVKMDVVWPEITLQYLWIAHRQSRYGQRPPPGDSAGHYLPPRIGGCHLLCTRDKHPPLRSIEFNAIRKISRDIQRDAIRVHRMRQKFTMHIPQAVGWELSLSPYLHRPGVFRIHAPVRAVYMVRAPTRNHASSKLLTP